MKFYKVREEILKGKNIADLPLRVTFYARVSTESDEQLNSLDNQISFFEDFIKSNKNWTYVKGYIDEGISGSTVKKRKKFLQMIEDAKSDYFDLIVTKEVSRFSRNLLDSIKYTQELLANDVGVYFQSNGINTYDPNSEFILNMMGSVAQEEVKRLSSRVKWGHKEAIKKGRILGSSSITGYKKDDAKLVIVEEEAKKIKKIFELYATGKYGFYKLAMELHRQGINNYKGNIYDKDTLKRIIQNPKYKGYYRGHTTETIDYRTKQRVFIPKEEQIIYKDETIPAIVSEELWNQANEVLDSRSVLMKASKGNAKRLERKYCYTTKIFCADHNVSYQRMSSLKKQTKPRWACGNYVKYRLDACESPIIAEMDLNNIFTIIMGKVFNNKNEIVKEMLDYYSNLKIDNNYQYEISSIKKEIKSIKEKKEKLLELNVDGSINNLEFKERNDKYNEEISALNTRARKVMQERKAMTDSFGNIKVIEGAIKKEVDYKNNVTEFVDKFLEEIIVYKEDNDRHKLLLKIYLNLLKKSIPTGTCARHINDDTYEPIFSNEVETLDLGRSDFQRNSFKINVYLS
jgi:DNA invertase Pin-like site-specific DNA recombinase